MDRLSSFAVDPVASQLCLLNVMLCIYLCCKGAAYVSRVLLRRDPPKKSMRSKVAHSDES
ncbi:hypothetical protein C6Q11_24275 [Burkholderia multivorans]|nr:hypothetical protein C6Q11_24275 [Burkholderia multivorans]